MLREAPNFLEGGPEVPVTGPAGWHETGDGHILPYQIIGDLQGADNVAMVHHGGPGDSTKLSHLTPLLGIDGLAILAYNQRLSGAGNKYSEYHGHEKDPLDTHTPEHLVQDIEDMRASILGGRVISHVGGSWAPALMLLHSEAHPDAVEDLLIWSATLARTKEALAAYEADGPLAQSRPDEYGRFINTIPELVRREISGNPSEIVRFYDRAMNPTHEDYDGTLARDLAMAFGLLHLSAADPEGIGSYGLVDLDTETLYPMAEEMGINPQLYARVAMRYFAQHFPRIGEGEGDIIRNIGRLTGKRMHIISGGEDPLTPASASFELASEAAAVGVDVTMNLVEGGHHDREHEPMQAAIQKSAQKLFGTR